MPRLLHELAVSRGDGSYTRLLARLAKLDLLAIDDWLLAPLRDGERRDLIEVIEDRTERGSTLIATQVPSKEWHASIGDPNQADAICDRLLHNAHRIELKGADHTQHQGRAQDAKRDNFMTTVASLRPLRGGMPRVVPDSPRRSWGILGPPRRSRDLWILPEAWKAPATPTDEAKTPEAFPTPPWTALRAAHRLHRPRQGSVSTTDRRIIPATNAAKEVPT